MIFIAVRTPQLPFSENIQLVYISVHGELLQLGLLLQ